MANNRRRGGGDAVLEKLLVAVMCPAQIVSLALWAFGIIPAIYGLLPATIVGGWVMWMVLNYFLSELMHWVQSKNERP